MTVESKTVSVRIERPWRDVYAFLAEPANFARWASGLGDGFRRDGDDWVAQGPEGPIRIRFTPSNPFGVVDHHVTVAPGVVVYVPMRVIANGTGSEVMLTLLRTTGMDDAKFAADAEWIARDLQRLKAVLEPS